MTPKFKYDPEQHCLREVARMKEPLAGYYKNMSHYWEDLTSYEQHLASLRVIPCASLEKFPDGDLVEGRDFTANNGIAIPIVQPRLYTQAEAEEIYMSGWSDNNKFKSSNEAFVNPRSHFAKQYFKTRFNVEL